MKTWLKLVLISVVSLTFFACEDTSDSAVIEIANLSDFQAIVEIYNYGYSPLTFTINANSTREIVIDDGDAGLNVNGGRAIIEYYHKYGGNIMPETYETFADLSVDATAYVQITNEFGCLLIQSYSTNDYGDMWVYIDNAVDPIILAPWEDLPLFYNPPGEFITKFVEYGGYTKFEDTALKSVYSDQITTLELHPDGCGIWVENNSSSDNIYYVYLSPSSSPYWGDDQLGSDILYPGEWAAWVCESNQYWDIMIEDTFYQYVWEDEYLATDDILIIDYTDNMRNIVEDPYAEKIKRAEKYQTPARISRLQRIPDERLNK